MKLYSNKTRKGDIDDHEEKWGNANDVRIQKFVT